MRISRKPSVAKVHFSQKLLKVENPSILAPDYTANIYSNFTVIGCVTFPTVIWQQLLQPMAVHMMLTGIEEYRLRLNTVLDCTMNNHITVGNLTLLKALLNTVKITPALWQRSCEKITDL